MSDLDLAKARDLAKQLHDVDYASRLDQDALIDLIGDLLTKAAEMFPAALDKIEEQAKEIRKLRDETIPEAVDAERARWFHDYQQQAKRISELEAYTPDHPDWSKDYELVQSDELAKKWYMAYSKAQSSLNVMRQWKETLEETNVAWHKRIADLEKALKIEKAQNLLNFQRHDEGDKRSWDDLSEDEKNVRIEFAGECLEMEGLLGGEQE